MFYNDFPLNTQGKELVGQSSGTPDACKDPSEFRINPDCSFEAQGSKFCISGVSSSSSNCWSVRLERSGPPWGQGLSKTHDLTRTSSNPPTSSCTGSVFTRPNYLHRGWSLKRENARIEGISLLSCHGMFQTNQICQPTLMWRIWHGDLPWILVDSDRSPLLDLTAFFQTRWIGGFTAPIIRPQNIRLQTSWCEFSGKSISTQLCLYGPWEK